MAQATDAVWLPVLPDMSGFGKGIVAGAGQQADKSGKAVGGRFGKAMLAGAAVVAGGAVLATKALYGIGETFAEVENTIRVGTGATGDALADLVDSAKNVGNNVPAEFEAIGTMVADVNTRLGLTGETLETFASQALEAGRMLGEEIDINAMSSAFNVFQIQGEDTIGAMDRLFQISQATGVGMNELASSVAANAPAVQGLGFSFEETAALVGNLDKAGLNSNKMMAGMGRALVELAKDGEEPQEAFKRVTAEIQGFLEEGDKASAVDLASDLFGTRNASQFIGALETGALAMDDLASVAGMTEDTILGAGEETMEFGEKWQLFKNRIINEIEPAATALFDAIGDGMEWVTNTLLPAFMAGWSGSDGPGGTFQDIGEKARGAFEWIKENKDIVLGLVGALVAAKAAVVAYNAAMTIWRGITTTITALTKAKTVAMRVLNTVMRMNPIGLVVTALMLLVGAFKLAWDNSETFRNIVTAAWEGIKAAASAVWDWLKRAFQWMKDGMASLGKWFSDRGKDISNVWTGIKDGIKAAWDFISDVVFLPMRLGIEAVQIGFELAKDGIGIAWDAVKTALKAGWDWINDKVFAPFGRGIETLVGWVRDGRDNIGTLWDGVKALFAAPINWVIDNVWNGGIARVFNSVAEAIGVGTRLPEVSRIDTGGAARGRSSGRGRAAVQARAEGGPFGPGWLLVGEEGPELMRVHGTGHVYNNRETQAMLAGQSGNPVQGAFSASNPPHGGIGGWIGDRWDNIKSGARWVADGVRDAAGNVLKWVRGGLAKAAEVVFTPIRGLIDSTLGSGAGQFGSLIAGTSTSMIDSLLDWIRGHDEGAAPDSGGRSLRGAQPHVNNAAWALADAVGGIRQMQAFNQSMAGGHPKGLAVDFIDSVSKLNRLADVISGGGHFDNFNYMAWQARLWSPGGGWRPQGRGYGNDPMHRWHLHAEWYDQGGFLKPGMGMYANATGKPEPVLTQQQWRDVSTLAARGGGEGAAVFHLYDTDRVLIGTIRGEADGRIGEARRRARIVG